MRAGRAPCGLAQTENVCGRITARVFRYHDSRIQWARENFLVLFLITPPFFPLQISHQKELSHGYYRMGDHNISTSRSLEMIGKISLVMWLHFNQSYSKNLSMWDIISTIFSVLLQHTIFNKSMKYDGKILCVHINKQTNKLLSILQSTSKYWTLIVLHIVSWEPEGHYHYSKMFHWKPEGHYCCTKSMRITAFWLSTEHLLIMSTLLALNWRYLYWGPG